MDKKREEPFPFLSWRRELSAERTLALEHTGEIKKT